MNLIRNVDAFSNPLQCAVPAVSQQAQKAYRFACNCNAGPFDSNSRLHTLGKNGSHRCPVTDIGSLPYVIHSLKSAGCPGPSICHPGIQSQIYSFSIVITRAQSLLSRSVFEPTFITFPSYSDPDLEDFCYFPDRLWKAGIWRYLPTEAQSFATGHYGQAIKKYRNVNSISHEHVQESRPPGRPPCNGP